jgi:hypothetical protein
LGAAFDIVAAKRLKTKVSVSLDLGIDVNKSGHITSWCFGILGLFVEGFIREEGFNGIGFDVGSITYMIISLKVPRRKGLLTIWLNCTGIFWVDEPTVSPRLGLSRTRCLRAGCRSAS